MDQYCRYLKETLAHELYRDPEGRGFLTYGFDCIPGVTFPHVYIIDIFVESEHRRSGVATSMADKICTLAAQQGISRCFGSISKHAKTKEASRKVLEAYGMRLASEDNDTFWYVKEI